MGAQFTFFGRCDHQYLYQNLVTCRPPRASILHCYQDVYIVYRRRHHQTPQWRAAVLLTYEDIETFPAYKETTIESTHGNHVVRYSGNEYSDTWCHICIE